MGDGGFRTKDIMTSCDDHLGWQFHLRLKVNQDVTLLNGQVTPSADVRLRPSMVRFLHGALYLNVKSVSQLA
jgi:hypothetical protein